MVQKSSQVSCLIVPNDRTSMQPALALPRARNMESPHNQPRQKKPLHKGEQYTNWWSKNPVLDPKTHMRKSV